MYRARVTLVVCMVASLLVGVAVPPAGAVAAAGVPDPSDTSVPVKPLTASVPDFPGMAPMSAKAVRWPVAGSAVVPVGGGADVGGLPVRVGHARTDASAAASVRVEVVGEAVARRAGYTLMLRVSQMDGLGAGGRVRVEVDYSAFRDAFGADWANRLTMVMLPTCVLQTPQVAGCAGQTVLDGQPAQARGVEC